MAQTDKSTTIATNGFLLDGQWVTSGDAVELLSPANRAAIARMAQPNRGQVEAAITAAQRAFGVTRKLPSGERQRILHEVASGVAARREEFARTMAMEAAKPLKAARVEVDRAVFTFNVAAEESTRISGEWLPMDLLPSTAGRWSIVRSFPVGPISAITPFNFPLNLVAHKLGPAMAAGCTVVHKPAPQTPLCALKLADIIHNAGWPSGALNVLPAAVADAEPMITDDRIKLLSFTGSAAVGWHLKQQAGKKRVVLELGGNAAVIIHHDADLTYAAERCVLGGFSYSGQTCISVQRILVHQTIMENFLAEFVPRVRKLQVGDPLQETTDVGPLISVASARRAEEWIGEAVSGGARLLCGGQRQGSLIVPAVLTGTTPSHRINCQEVFAPVVTVEPYRDFSEALARANDSPYGLQAGLFTHDARLIFQAFDELAVGGVIAGDVPSFRVDHMPYGGIKDSGLGREGVKYAMEEMTERKILVVNLA
jgi:acyl-CoA reductase-like NAD-dependent aldehyde dehydrogenase